MAVNIRLMSLQRKYFLHIWQFWKILCIAHFRWMLLPIIQ